MKEIEKMGDLLDLSIEFFHFPVRVYNCLARNGYKTIGEVIINPTSKIKNIKNLGEKNYKELLNIVHSNNLIFIDEDKNQVDEDTYEKIINYQKNYLEEIEKEKKAIQELNNKYRALLYSSNILNLPIEKLNLPINIYYNLKDFNINIVGEIIRYRSYSLESMMRSNANFNILINKLNSIGLLLLDEKVTEEAYNQLDQTVNLKLVDYELTGVKENNEKNILITIKKIKELREILIRVMQELNTLNNEVVRYYNDYTKKR